MLFAPLALLGLAAPALATIYTTSPVASTIAVGGQVLNVSWIDDGATPSLETIGVCSVDLCVGSTIQQTCLQNLAESVDVSKASSVSTTVDPTIGESGDFWFVRFTSAAYTNSTNSQPYQQFSARFQLDNMTGTFDAAVSSQLAATAAASTSAVPTTSAAVVTTKASTSAAATTHAANSTAAKATAAATTSASGAVDLVAPFGLALLAGIAGYIAL